MFPSKLLLTPKKSWDIFDDQNDKKEMHEYETPDKLPSISKLIANISLNNTRDHKVKSKFLHAAFKDQGVYYDNSIEITDFNCNEDDFVSDFVTKDINFNDEDESEEE